MPAARSLPRHRIAFAIWSWIAVATALVCALVPAGLPSTRAIGSAFDPSTTIVALRSAAPVAKASARAEDDGDDKRSTPSPYSQALLPMAAQVPLLLAVVEPLFAADRPFVLPAPAPDPLRYARPPPVR